MRRRGGRRRAALPDVPRRARHPLVLTARHPGLCLRRGSPRHLPRPRRVHRRSRHAPLRRRLRALRPAFILKSFSALTVESCARARATAACSIGLAALLVACAPAEAPDTLESRLAPVNPFIGTQNFGNTFPGAALPFGMVQVSPDNGGQGGYDYDNTRIDGFSQTHLSGVGCGALGELPIMPTTGAVDLDEPVALRLALPPRRREGAARLLPRRPHEVRHRGRADRDHAHRLAALHVPGRPARPTCCSTPAGRTCRCTHSEVRRTGDRTARGLGRGRRLLRRPRPPPRLLHRHASTGRSPRTAPGGAASDARRSPDARAARGINGAWVTFDATPNRDVGLKVGLSYTGLDGARATWRRRRTGYDFDARRRRGSRALGVDARTSARSTAGRATGASPSTPRSTTRCCTRT